MKITNELKNKIILLKQEKKTHREIAKMLDLKESTIGYWINPETRKKHIESAKKYFSRKSQEEKKKYYQSRKEYIKIYSHNKYVNDPIFRDKQKERAKLYNRKVRMKGGVQWQTDGKQSQ